MCNIFPNKLSESARNNAISKAEIKLYDEFTRQLGDKWTVFYNVAWLGCARGTSPIDGETDFIICHPDKGVLLMEVKGGRIRYDGNFRQWYSRDKFDNEHKIDPFKQVVNSKYALINKIRSLPGWGSRWVELYHCVAFPDALKPTTEVAPDSPPEIIVDVEDRNNLEKRLEEIFEYWRGREKTRICDYPRLINQLREMLSCDYELDNPLYFEALEEEKKIINLTEQQFDILSMMCKNRKASIGGCAGSGKTLLAAEKALRLSKQGMRTLLTCYNKGLGNHLAQVLKDRENLEVVHFHHLCHTYAEKAGVELSKTYDSNFFEYELPEAFCKALEKEPSLKFDAVIVDEGQDFKEVWWLALMESLKSPEDGIFYIFYDNNQNIYHGVENIFSNFASLSLNHNLRNTKCIFKLIRQFYDSDTPVECRAPMGRPVEIVSYSGQQGMKKKLGGIIHKLIVEERFHPGDLSVLCMRSIAPDGYANVHEGDRIGNFILKQEPENQNDIQLSTVYSFKGLENRVVIITDIDNYYLGNIERYKNLFYVGFSRARNHLVLLCEEGAGELIEKFR